jgi:hypothetical protein
MFLPRDLNGLILQYVAAPKISELLVHCFEDQLSYASSCDKATTTFRIQPACPAGRQTIQGWEPNLKFVIARGTNYDGDTTYQFSIEVVWNGHPNGLSVFHFEPARAEIDIYDLDFSVVDTMPRAITDVPEYFVGHVWDIECRDFYGPCAQNCSYNQTESDLVTRYSFSAFPMLEILEEM